MSDNDTVEYYPVSVARAAWSDEQETILSCRSRFIAGIETEQAFDASSEHYLARNNDTVVGYLCIDNDGHISQAVTQTEHANDIAEALMRCAVLDTPQRGFARLSAPTSHPWNAIFLPWVFPPNAASTPKSPCFFCHQIAVLLPAALIW
jgi:hypothetical protein